MSIKASKILLFVIGIHSISARISTVKKWIPDTNYESAENWDPKRVPCESDRIIYSKIFDEEVYLSKQHILVREILLPRTGNILLKKDDMIELSSDAIQYPDCPGGDVTFKANIEEPWMLSKNWMDVNAKEQNLAIPHSERIPCEDDDVILEYNKSYTILMPRDTQMVKSIDNLISKLTNEDWKTQIELRPLAFHEWEDAESPSVRIKPYINLNCQIKETCLCQKEQSILELCENEKKFCPLTMCLEPVQPINHCCKICGGVLNLMEDKDFDVSDLRKKIQDKLNEWKIDGIDWHISTVADTGRKYQIQIIIVEKSLYDGRSVDLAKRLSQEFTKSVSGIRMNLSGMSWDPSRTGGWEIVVMFFVVGLFFTGLMLYYYSPSAIVDANPFRPLGFARFENRSREGSLMLAVSQLSLNKAFDNPMYDKAATPSDKNTEFKEEPLNDSDTEEEHVSEETNTP